MLLTRLHMQIFTGGRSVAALHCKQRRLIKSSSFLEDLLPKRTKVDTKSAWC